MSLLYHPIRDCWCAIGYPQGCTIQRPDDVCTWTPDPFGKGDRGAESLERDEILATWNVADVRIGDCLALRWLPLLKPLFGHPLLIRGVVIEADDDHLLVRWHLDEWECARLQDELRVNLA